MWILGKSLIYSGLLNEGVFNWGFLFFVSVWFASVCNETSFNLFGSS